MITPARRLRSGLVISVVTATVLFSGCGVSVGDKGSEGGKGTGAAAPPLSEVEPLDDVRDWEGSVNAVAEEQVEPVVDQAEPQLPVTVTDAQGTKVTVTDASRILPLDIYGTLSRTVFELGLGDQVVGREIATQFDAAADLPLVTQNGHDLNAEAILELDPDGDHHRHLARAVGRRSCRCATPASRSWWSTPSARSTPSRSLIEDVAEALGVPEQGAALAERTQAEIDAVTEQIAEVAPRGRGRQAAHGVPLRPRPVRRLLHVRRGAPAPTP